MRKTRKNIYKKRKSNQYGGKSLKNIKRKKSIGRKTTLRKYKAKGGSFFSKSDNKKDDKKNKNNNNRESSNIGSSNRGSNSRGGGDGGGNSGGGGGNCNATASGPNFGDIGAGIWFGSILNWVGRGLLNVTVNALKLGDNEPVKLFESAANSKPLKMGEESSKFFGGTSKAINGFRDGGYSVRQHARHAKRLEEKQKKLREIYGGEYKKYL